MEETENVNLLIGSVSAQDMFKWPMRASSDKMIDKHQLSVTEKKYCIFFGVTFIPVDAKQVILSERESSLKEIQKRCESKSWFPTNRPE